MTFALFFLAEYMNMILIAALASIMFLGGWLSPLPILNDVDDLRRRIRSAPASRGSCSKMSFVLFIFLWIRATFPRYRYDQIMRLGWKVFIPVTLVWIVVRRRDDADALRRPVPLTMKIAAIARPRLLQHLAPARAAEGPRR